jgi:hypothetical protein
MKTIRKLLLLAGISGPGSPAVNPAAARTGRRRTRQRLPFQDLRITKLCKDRCRFIENPTVRICLQLSAPPPLGWSYLFSCAWRATAYPLKRRAGLEDDMLWIECAPEEVAQYHLEELEKAVSQTNANFRFNVEQRAAAEQRQRELNARTQAQLDELGDYLDSSADSTAASDKPEAIRPNILGGIIGLLRLLSGIRRKDAGEMVSHGA